MRGKAKALQKREERQEGGLKRTDSGCSRRSLLGEQRRDPDH